MENLNQKILNSLVNEDDISSTLEDLSIYEENLINNSLNPIFSKSDKNKIMKTYMDLHEIGTSLARYKTLLTNNMRAEAKKERDKLSNTVLKGGVSNYYCIWHANDDPKTCNACKALDGKVFDLIDGIPEDPHPNCKCTIEIVEKPKNKIETAIDKAGDAIKGSLEVGINKLGNFKEKTLNKKNDYTFAMKKIREWAKNFSNKRLKGYNDANLLMQLALSPEVWTPNMCYNDYLLVQKWQSIREFNHLSKEFQNAIPQDLPKVIFSSNSHMANSLNNSPELKTQIKKALEEDVTHFSVVLEQDRNLLYAIHKAEIYDYRITNDGYFEGYLADTYDFEFLLDQLLNSNSGISTATYNDIAYYLQVYHVIRPYYLIVPIHVKL